MENVISCAVKVKLLVYVFYVKTKWFLNVRPRWETEYVRRWTIKKILGDSTISIERYASQLKGMLSKM